MIFGQEYAIRASWFTYEKYENDLELLIFRTKTLTFFTLSFKANYDLKPMAKPILNTYIILYIYIIICSDIHHDLKFNNLKKLSKYVIVVHNRVCWVHLI